MKKILLPIDQSTEEREVIDEAVQLAKKFNSKLILFSVDNSKELIKDLYTGGFIDSYELVKRTQDSVLIEGMKKMHEFKYESIKDTNFLEGIKNMYEIKGVNAEIIVQKGDPASAIIDETEKGGYDLVIMKSHTLKKRNRFMLGSVTNKVVHHVKIPILIVR